MQQPTQQPDPNNPQSILDYMNSKEAKEERDQMAKIKSQVDHEMTIHKFRRNLQQMGVVLPQK